MYRYIDSPALGSAGPLMKRVCYGLVLPGLIIGVTLYVHIPAKYGESLSHLPTVQSAVMWWLPCHMLMS